jgi:EmrB/QacA subfamily drug resistance transporter
MACLGVFIAYLPITTVAISLPAIQQALHTTTAQLAWVQDAFVLPLAAFVLTAGVFGDVHGRKKVFQAGLLLAAGGAMLALCASNIQMLWAGQVIAGLGSAALLPTTLALISHAVPDYRDRGKFIGIWAMALLAALAVGPVIAGVILDHAAWRWIYLLPIPASLLVLAAAARLLPDSHAVRGRRLDWPGQVTATLAITALVYGVIEGGAGSFTDVRVLSALALGAIALAAFVLVERRSSSPMLDLALFRSPAFTATALVALISFLALIGFFFALSLYFGMVQQLDTLHAGARLILVPLAAIIAGAPTGRLMHRIPARYLITGGLLLITAALASLTSLEADTSLASIGWRLVLLGLGMGVVMTPMTAAAVGSVPHHLAGMASAGNNAFRQIGGALGPAVLGTLLSAKAIATLDSHLTTAGITGPLHQQVVATATAHGLGAVAHLNLGAHVDLVYAALGDSLLDGLHLCLVVAAALNAIAAACALILLRERRTPTTVAPQDHPAATVLSGASHN